MTSEPSDAYLIPMSADRSAPTAEAAIRSRQSVRAFRNEPVPRELVERILNIAARAPSGTNMQPWRVHVLTGAARKALCDAVLAARHGEEKHEPEFDYYPRQWREPYLSRRRKVGWDLYGLLGIGKGETERMRRQHDRNFTFFDAPVGMIFTVDRDLPVGSWLDCGMFLQNIMVAARGFGLDTCPQAAWAAYHRIIVEVLRIPPEQMVVCGMALGHADTAAVENGLRTVREPLQAFAAFHDAV